MSPLTEVYVEADSVLRQKVVLRKKLTAEQAEAAFVRIVVRACLGVVPMLTHLSQSLGHEFDLVI